mmetsp:Transcript_10720/g.17612  ORF Transcript_10720/g.17612 Transcript_10720/m.17612 type:complete len:302 (+) Transcript_10720:54-959(+)
MEATLRSLLNDALSDYVQKGFDQVETLSFPMVISDIELNTKRLNHAFHDSPMDLTYGKIGNIRLIPSWMGTLDVVATDIELKFSFSPTKAMRNSMKRAMDDSEDTALAAAIAASLEDPPKPATELGSCQPCPRFCCAHDKSEKRMKSNREVKQCSHCGSKVRCSYKGFRLCPWCSDSLQKCTICASPVTQSGKAHPADYARENNANDIAIAICEEFAQRPRQPLFMKQSVASRVCGAAIDTNSTTYLSRTRPSLFESFFGNISSDWWKLCVDGNGVHSDGRSESRKDLPQPRTRPHSYGGA